MHKLVILIEPPADHFAFDEGWPSFLHLAEAMPGLVSEATARVSSTLYGDYNVSTIHELFFDTSEDLQRAMTSPQGKAAGRVLQQITGGRMTLLVAEHREDSIENLRKFKAEFSAV